MFNIVNNIRSIIKRAFKSYSDVADLEFEPNSKNPDLKISFVGKEHGDNHDFDGKGGTLAHAFFPENGSIHFDNDEDFTDNSVEGTNLLQVAVHEIGFQTFRLIDFIKNSKL